MAKKNSLDYWTNLFRMNNLIYRKNTGNAPNFAKKMGMSRSAVYRHIEDLRSLNAPIEYDSYRQTYFYQEPYSLADEIKKHCC